MSKQGARQAPCNFTKYQYFNMKNDYKKLIYFNLKFIKNFFENIKKYHCNIYIDMLLYNCSKGT